MYFKTVRTFTFLGALFCFLSCKPTSQTLIERAPEEISSLDTVFQNYNNDFTDLIREKEMAIKHYHSSATRTFDLIHTELRLSFDYTRQAVLGEALLTLTPFIYSQNELVLDAKDFEIHETMLLDAEQATPLTFAYDQEAIRLKLPREFTREDTLHVKITYTAFPEKGDGESSAAISDSKGLYFINPDSSDSSKPVQIWTQGETTYTSKWYPTIDHPNERQTHDFYLRVPEGYVSLSNGKLMSSEKHGDGYRTDHWRMGLPHAPYLSALVIGDFEVIEADTVAGVPLRYFTEPGFKEGAKEVFAHTPEMMRFFSEILNTPFPWQKYDQVVVRDFVSGAMENTTLSVFMEGLQLNKREALDSEWDYIIAHELFHQWFGNYVTTESWANLTLNEGFADYSEYLWMEYKEGRDQADMHHFNAMEQYLDEAKEKRKPLIRYFYDDSEELFDSHTYAKGGRVLHMLRRYLGDEVFFHALHNYLKENAFQTVEIHHLRLAFEKVSGMDLNWFFNQWYFYPGHPKLAMKWDFTQNDQIILTVEQLQDLSENPLYKIPFTVSMYKEGERTVKEFVLEQASQEFTLGKSSELDGVIFDEHHTLLAEKVHYRGREFLETQFLTSQSGLARVEALDSLTSSYEGEKRNGKVFQKALNDSFAVVRELALQRMLRMGDRREFISEWEANIYEMVENDPTSAVRSVALEVLAEFDSEKYKPLFYRLVNDASYQVSGAALVAIMDLEGEAEMKKALFERFKAEENIRVIAPLADYLTQKEQVEEASWMDEKLDLLSGESLYYFIGYYGDYYARVEGAADSVAIDRLGKLSREHPLNYVRLAAFQSLFGFIDQEGVVKLAQSLFASEKDEMVRRYQGYYLEPYLKEE